MEAKKHFAWLDSFFPGGLVASKSFPRTTLLLVVSMKKNYENRSGNVKVFYSYLGRRIKSLPKLSMLKNFDGALVEGDFQWANLIAQHFSSVF